MAEIDSLEIRIQAQATKANDAIDKLDDKLERLERALSSLNKVNIANFANGVDKLSKAMVNMNQVKTTDFTRLAKNLANLSTVNVAGLNSSASAVIMLSKAFGQLSTATQNANNIAIFANALSNLLPAKMIPVMIEMCGISARQKVNTITRAQRENLCRLLKAFPFTVIAAGGWEEAFELDPSALIGYFCSLLFYLGIFLFSVKKRV